MSQGTQSGTVAVDNPRADDVRLLLEQHHLFARENTPPGYIHALDSEGLLDPAVTFFTLREGGRLIAMGAMMQLDDTHIELKSMHTTGSERRQGAARIVLDHLISEARRSGAHRVSIETGSTPGFAPSRALFEGAGFVRCGPFGSYERNPSSTFMTLDVTPGAE